MQCNNLKPTNSETKIIEGFGPQKKKKDHKKKKNIYKGGIKIRKEHAS